MGFGANMHFGFTKIFLFSPEIRLRRTSLACTGPCPSRVRSWSTWQSTRRRTPRLSGTTARGSARSGRSTCRPLWATSPRRTLQPLRYLNRSIENLFYSLFSDWYYKASFSISSNILMFALKHSIEFALNRLIRRRYAEIKYQLWLAVPSHVYILDQ